MTKLAKPFQNALLSGPQGTLVPFVETMICDDYIRWLNTPGVNRFLEVRHTSQTLASVTEFVGNAYVDPMRYFWGIRLRENDKLIGTATLYRSPERFSGEVGLMIGETASWGTGISEEVIDLIAQFAFGKLGLRRLTGGTYASNMGINFTMKRMGFTREGTLRKCRQVEDGSFVDEFLWGVLAEEWKVRYPLSLRERQAQ